jgi:hypothetical protein
VITEGGKIVWLAGQTTMTNLEGAPRASTRSWSTAPRSPRTTPAGSYEPRGLAAAQHNLPFCPATFLLEGDCFVDQFDAAAITALGAKHRHSVRIEVRLGNGGELRDAVPGLEVLRDAAPLAALMSWPSDPPNGSA